MSRKKDSKSDIIRIETRKGRANMDDSMMILRNKLEIQGLDEETIEGILMSHEEDEDMLYLAEWVTNHPEAQRRDALKAMHNLLRRRLI